MPVKPNDFYSAFHTLYDLMIDWPARLAEDIPALKKAFETAGAPGADKGAKPALLDVACGTGHHAWSLADEGFDVTGTDANADLLSLAERPRGEEGWEPRFIRWDMAEPPHSGLAPESFDHIVCLGNSFPHLTDDARATAALTNFARLLKPDGLTLVQMKNLWRRRQAGEKRLKTVEHPLTSGGGLVRFERSYDFGVGGEDQALFRLEITGAKTLLQQTPMRVWTAKAFAQTAACAGFRRCDFFEDLACEREFAADQSEDMVAWLRR